MSSTLFRDVRAVLFDLDGTLLDSAPDLGAAVDGMRTERGLPSLPFSHYRPHAGSGARGMLRVAFDVTPDDQAYETLRDEFYARYEARLTTLTRPFHGVPELLHALQAGKLVWGVVTNKSMRFTAPLTRALSLFDTAGTVIGGDTTPHTKPHPAPLLEAARQLRLDPVHCVYIGDDHRDILAGQAAGMRTMAARYGYLGPGADVGAWGADAEVSSPLQVLKFLEVP